MSIFCLINQYFFVLILLCHRSMEQTLYNIQLGTGGYKYNIWGRRSVSDVDDDASDFDDKQSCGCHSSKTNEYIFCSPPWCGYVCMACHCSGAFQGLWHPHTHHHYHHRRCRRRRNSSSSLELHVCLRRIFSCGHFCVWWICTALLLLPRLLCWVG